MGLPRDSEIGHVWRIRQESFAGAVMLAISWATYGAGVPPPHAMEHR
jgi:hypothetical protein